MIRRYAIYVTIWVAALVVNMIVLDRSMMMMIVFVIVRVERDARS